MCGYMTKYGSKQITSSPGFTVASSGQHEPAAGAAGDEHVALRMIEMREAGLRVGEQFLAERGDALSDGIAVLAGVDGGLGRGLDRFRHVEIRLTDAQVDGIGQRFRQVEHLANAGHFDVVRAFGEPGIGNHGVPRKNGRFLL